MMRVMTMWVVLFLEEFVRRMRRLSTRQCTDWGRVLGIQRSRLTATANDHRITLLFINSHKHDGMILFHSPNIYCFDLHILLNHLSIQMYAICSQKSLRDAPCWHTSLLLTDRVVFDPALVELDQRKRMLPQDFVFGCPSHLTVILYQIQEDLVSSADLFDYDTFIVGFLLLLHFDIEHFLQRLFGLLELDYFGAALMRNGLTRLRIGMIDRLLNNFLLCFWRWFVLVLDGLLLIAIGFMINLLRFLAADCPHLWQRFVLSYCLAF